MARSATTMTITLRVLIEQARIAALKTAHLSADSRSLRDRAAALTLKASLISERVSAARIGRLRSPGTGGAMPQTLPLTPPLLRELADEFRHHAETAETPESRAAFRHLEYRYTALAAGFDTERIGSPRVH